MERDGSLEVLYKDLVGLYSGDDKEHFNYVIYRMIFVLACLKEALKENPFAHYCFSNRLTAIYLDSQMTNHKTHNRLKKVNSTSEVVEYNTKGN